MMVLSTRRIVLSLTTIALVLACLSALHTTITRIAQETLHFSLALSALLRMGLEGSLPSWYGAILFLVCAVVLIFIARQPGQQSFRRFSLVLISLTFAVAVDQGTNTYKRLLAVLSDLTGNRDSVWTIAAVGIVLALVFLSASRPLIKSWPARAGRFYMLAGVLIAAGYVVSISTYNLTSGTRMLEIVATSLRIAGALSLLVAALTGLGREAPNLELHFDAAGRLLRLLLAIAAFFTLVTSLLRVLEQHVSLDSYDPYHFLYLFDTSKEANVPTVYAYGTLLLCAGLLALIAVGRKRDGAPFARHWAFLSAVFVLLSIDEGASLHERLMEPMRVVLSKLSVSSTGSLNNAWIIPVGILLLIMLIFYIPFLRHLPPKVLRWFFISGMIYVMGASGFEIPEGYLAKHYGSDNGLLLALETIEEMVEMIGIALFIYTLTQYLREYIGTLVVSLRVRPGNRRDVDATPAQSL